MTYTKKCPKCNKVFKTTWRVKKYCSNKCSRRAGDNRRVSREKRRRISRVGHLSKQHGLVCWYCGSVLSDNNTHVDHIISKYEWKKIAGNLVGCNSFTNLALACNFCNLAKNKYPLKDFLEWLYRKDKKLRFHTGSIWSILTDRVSNPWNTTPQPLTIKQKGVLKAY